MQSVSRLTAAELDAVYIEHLHEYIRDYCVTCTSVNSDPVFMRNDVCKKTIKLFKDFGLHLQHYYGTNHRFSDIEKFKYYLQCLNLYTDGEYQKCIMSKLKYSFLTGHCIPEVNTTVAQRITQRYRISSQLYTAMNENGCWKLVLKADGKVDNKATVDVSLKNYLNFKIEKVVAKYTVGLQANINDFKAIRTNKWIDGYLIITNEYDIVESNTDFYPGAKAALKLYENYNLSLIKFYCKKIQSEIKKAQKWYTNMTHPIYNLLY